MFYTRISSENQASNSNLKNQKSVLLESKRRAEHLLFSHVASGQTRERRALKGVFSSMKRGVRSNIVRVTTVDGLTRNVPHGIEIFYELQHQGVQLWPLKEMKPIDPKGKSLPVPRKELQLPTCHWLK